MMYNELFEAWNCTDKNYPSGKTIQELFEKQVEKNPDKVAVIYNNQQLTFEELNQAANRLASYLKEFYKDQGLVLTPDTFISFCLDKSLEMIVVILGILKAGGVYTPIDPSYPITRINHIINDSQARIVLTQDSHLDLLNSTVAQDIPVKFKTISLSEPYFLSMYSNLNHEISNTPKDLAYLVYTSGTTGTPKGVMISHASVVNYVHWIYGHEAYAASERMDCSASIAYGSTMKVFLPPLLFGKTLVFCDDETKKDALSYIEYIERQSISLINLTGTYLSALLAMLEHEELRKKLQGLDCLIVGNEKAYQEDVKKWMTFLPNCKVIHHYGSTELTVGCTSYTAFNHDTRWDSIPLGKIAYNNKAYIIDADNNLVEMGEKGELAVSGAHLARGYLNQPELTKDRFIKNPFATEEELTKGYDIIYKTGDIVRWLPDGNLEYIGRRDFQVKLRGFRIELGEIEAVLRLHVKVKDAVMMALGKGNRKHLVAYIVATDSLLSTEDISELVAKYLPDYMVPNTYVFIDSIPMNINGKIDRHALPEPSIDINKVKYVAPRTNLQKTICKVWRQVLSLERIGIYDDFFKLGGDSIQCIQVSAGLLREEIDCRSRSIFTCRTVESLARTLKTMPKTVAEQGLLQGSFGLLPVQAWFFENKHSSLSHWEHAFLIRVPLLSIEKLQLVSEQILEHHDSLRLRFREDENGVWEQDYDSAITPENLRVLDVSDFSDEKIQKQLTKWQSGFNPKMSPLWRMSYLHGYADGSARLFIAYQYLILDAISLRILISDIKHLYEGKPLGTKSSSYRQWVEDVNEYPKNNPEEIYYWQKIEGSIKYNYPVLKSSPFVTTLKLNSQTTKQLLTLAHDTYNTDMNDLLLTALAYSLRDCMDESEHVIMLASHGRDMPDVDTNVSRTTGWFTSFFPVKLQTQFTLKKSIQCIKEMLHLVPNKGVAYGAFKKSNPHVLSADLPTITFNYQGQFDSDTGDWQLSGEPAGVSDNALLKQKHVISILVRILNGKLSFSISTHISKLLARQLAEALENRLNEVLSHCLTQTNQCFTPCDFPEVKLNQELLDKLQTCEHKIESIYPANNLQKGILYHALSQEDDDAYRVQLLLDYHCELELDKYKDAWELVIKTYPALRTYFNWEDELIQVISKDGKLSFTYHDIRKLKHKKQAIERIQRADRKRAFDLHSPTLLRLYLIQQSKTHFTLLRSVHHSIIDGWSAPILLHQAHKYYQDLLQNSQPIIQIDTAYESSQAYIAKHKDRATSFWKANYQNIDSVNDLNVLLSCKTDLDKATTVISSKEVSITLDDYTYQSLKELMEGEGLTPHTIVQFSWHKLINTYTEDPDTIVGTTVSGRALPIIGIEESVGMYINTLPLKISWDNRTILEQLKYIESAVIDLHEYSYVDLAGIQKHGKRLFHSLLVVDPPDINESDNSLPIEFNSYFSKVDYPLCLVMRVNADNLTIKLIFDQHLLDDVKAQKLLSQLQLIISQLPRNLGESTSNISVLTSFEYQSIVYDWNNTKAVYTKNKTIQQLFEEQVKKTPNDIALVFEDQQLTYKGLNQASNQLARYIRRQYKNKLVVDTRITICVDRSIDMIIGMLGILKAGGAYVPLDPISPVARIQFQLEDTDTRLLLTQTHIIPKVNNLLPTQVSIVTLDDKPYINEVSNNLEYNSSANDLAYVIYTSGTTGKPKGVMVEHQSFLFYQQRFIELVDKNQPLITSFTLSYCFDASLPTIFAGLLSGGSVVITKDILDITPDSYISLISNHKVNTLRLPLSFLKSLSSKLVSYSESLTIILGGEPYDINLVKTLLQNKHLRIFNQYGPTECVVGSSMYELSSSVEQQIIGTVHAGKKAYVLDSHLTPLPLGAIGELYIGGEGLARGYLNHPKLTKERFISNPFTEGRLYKTGDLVRWLADGNLE
ncbi:MAG: amino acid adenylation domain-containing protein, partial [Legionellaceae bacterium]|nr:amino acid adenylation domain-containing protein [Legionellaceae bacterium]